MPLWRHLKLQLLLLLALRQRLGLQLPGHEPETHLQFESLFVPL